MKCFRFVYCSKEANFRDGGYLIDELIGTYPVIDEILGHHNIRYLELELPSGETKWVPSDAVFELSKKVYLGDFLTPPVLFSTNPINRIDLNGLFENGRETQFFPISVEKITPEVSLYLTLKGDLYVAFYSRAKLFNTYFGKIPSGVLPEVGKALTINRLIRKDQKMVWSKTNTNIMVENVLQIIDKFFIVEGLILKSGESVRVTSFLSL